MVPLYLLLASVDTIQSNSEFLRSSWVYKIKTYGSRIWVKKEQCVFLTLWGVPSQICDELSLVPGEHDHKCVFRTLENRELGIMTSQRNVERFSHFPTANKETLEGLSGTPEGQGKNLTHSRVRHCSNHSLLKRLRVYLRKESSPLCVTDLHGFGVDALSHLCPSVRHQYGAIFVDVHQGRTLRGNISTDNRHIKKLTVDNGHMDKYHG